MYIILSLVKYNTKCLNSDMHMCAQSHKAHSRVGAHDHLSKLSHYTENRAKSKGGRSFARLWYMYLNMAHVYPNVPTHLTLSHYSQIRLPCT